MMLNYDKEKDVMQINRSMLVDGRRNHETLQNQRFPKFIHSSHRGQTCDISASAENLHSTLSLLSYVLEYSARDPKTEAAKG